MVHVDDINGRGIVRAEHHLTGAKSVGHVRLSARLFDDFAKAENVWRMLETSPGTSIHQTYDWARAWRHVPNGGMVVLLVCLDGKPAALLPLEIVRKAGFRIAQFAGTAHSNLNTPLYSAEFLLAADAAMIDELVETLQALAMPADLVVLDKLRPQVAGRPQPLLALPHILSQNPTFQLPLLADFDATLRQVNAKRRRKKFRQSERRLEALGGYRHIEAGDDETAGRLLDIFFAQKAVRLTEQGLRDVFSDPGVGDAFRQLASFSANAGRPPLRLHGLTIGNGGEERVLAVAGLTEIGGHVTCQFGSVDDRTAPDASAGELLFHLMIEQANGRGMTVFDFGVGDQRYKRSWCPVMTEHAIVHVPLNGRGQVAAGLLATTVRLKRLVKTSPRLMALAHRLRALRNGRRMAAEPAD